MFQAFIIFVILVGAWFLEPQVVNWLTNFGISGMLYKLIYMGFLIAVGIAVGAIWNPNPR